MNRRLQFINLFGVLALAVLCAAQWRRDRDLNLEVGRLDKTRQAQDQKISEEEEAARGVTADLDHFKQQFKEQHNDLENERHKSRDAENEAAKLTAERDQLKESVTNWANAVTRRDALIKEANGRIEDLSTNLNTSIRKYNELVTNYDDVVKQLNETRAKPAGTNN
jgi:chromosome segregation ATPase